MNGHSSTSDNTIVNATLRAAATSVIKLYRDIATDTYTIKYSISAGYKSKLFTSVSDPSISIKGGGTIYKYEIDDNPSLSVSLNSAKDTITLKSKYTVVTYYLIGGVDWLELGRNNNSGTVYWYAEDEL